ncbi:LysM peptidoglycan-binding domain-containing protein [uncultured Winogradskyella sp.]|uniref:LysM peptidoglycan-binding domain-containing protein n=1 Tax=uncultured Winogradskyella sp. TaxID=395353 RepID=UPI002638F859|nr:LysM peptidoglycan-binding domain-containing protein [uncultured Winogradskyella sp.]
MQKIFKLILSIVIVLLSGVLAFGQEEQKQKEIVTHKDVTLDGKPARLNVTTGEITFVNPADKRQPVKFENYVENSNKAQKPNPIKNTGVRYASNSTSASGIQPVIHTVMEGENLLKIAIRYGVKLNDLKRANNMETTLVKPGQKLRVSHLNAVNDQNLMNSQTTYASNASGSAVHIVEKGQTLYSLAKRYGLTVSELKQYNGLNSNLIKVGQKILLPNANADSSDNSITSWRVVEGDTLYSISIYTGTPVEELKRINGLANNIIKVGQQIDFKSKSATAKK